MLFSVRQFFVAWFFASWRWLAVDAIGSAVAWTAMCVGAKTMTQKTACNTAKACVLWVLCVGSSLSRAVRGSARLCSKVCYCNG